MPDYDVSNFDPPAPVAHVGFTNPITGQRIDNILMLLDTGADASVVPQAVCQALNLALQSSAYEIEFLAGGSTSWPSVRLQMHWQRLSFTGDFLVAQAQHGVIGRNILNHLRVVFDGLNLHWDM